MSYCLGFTLHMPSSLLMHFSTERVVLSPLNVSWGVKLNSASSAEDFLQYCETIMGVSRSWSDLSVSFTKAQLIPHLYLIESDMTNELLSSTKVSAAANGTLISGEEDEDEDEDEDEESEEEEMDEDVEEEEEDYDNQGALEALEDDVDEEEEEMGEDDDDDEITDADDEGPSSFSSGYSD